MASDIKVMNDTLSFSNQRFRYDTQQYMDKRLALSTAYNLKLSDKVLVKTGILANFINFEFYKSTKLRGNTSDINQIQSNTTVNGNGNTSTFQHYTQFSLLLNKWRLNGGYHYLRLGINGSQSLEPRMSIQYSLQANQKLSFSYGIHSQIPPMMNFFYQNVEGFVNRNLQLMKAEHAILAYTLYTGNKMRFILETYLQNLRNIPASPDGSSSYFMLNGYGNFPEFQVVSQGKGKNYGLDAAIEKAFSKSYYLLLTSSILDARFTMPDGRDFNSRFNSKFTSSATFGKEFYFKKKGSILQLGGRYLLKGGFRYTPLNQAASAEIGRYVEDATQIYAGQVPVYKRLDARISYSYNKPKMAGKINLDIQNVLNNINATSVGFNAESNTTYFLYRGSGLVPVLSFQWDF